METFPLQKGDGQMKIEDLVKEVSKLTDEELQEELAKLRAARRLRPEKTVRKRKSKKQVEIIDMDII